MKTKREIECVCVCEREREREKKNKRCIEKDGLSNWNRKRYTEAEERKRYKQIMSERENDREWHQGWKRERERERERVRVRKRQRNRNSKYMREAHKNIKTEWDGNRERQKERHIKKD